MMPVDQYMRMMQTRGIASTARHRCNIDYMDSYRSRHQATIPASDVVEPRAGGEEEKAAITRAEIAKHVGLSAVRVRQIELAALQKLRLALHGIDVMPGE